MGSTVFSPEYKAQNSFWSIIWERPKWFSLLSKLPHLDLPSPYRGLIVEKIGFEPITCNITLQILNQLKHFSKVDFQYQNKTVLLVLVHKLRLINLFQLKLRLLLSLYNHWTSNNTSKLLFYLFGVGKEGFEPPTSSVSARYSKPSELLAH